jgi:hypothetical protein
MTSIIEKCETTIQVQGSENVVLEAASTVCHRIVGTCAVAPKVVNDFQTLAANR